MRFLNERRQNYNELGDKVDSFCEDCEKKWFPFSFLWWDDNKNNIADIKRKDNGILVINKILSLINSISESIKDIYDKINVIEPPILSEKLLELENDYLEVGVTADDKQEDLNIAIYENYINLKNTKVDKPLIESTSDSLKIVALDNQGESFFIKSSEVGKVKSVNNKIGDVILKTSDLENDSDYTTNDILATHTSNKANPHNVTKEQLSLGNVDNTSDLNKPISTTTQTELNKKINKPTINNTPDYVLLADGSTTPKSDFGKVNSVNGINPDNNKNIKVGINEILKEYQPNIVADKNKKVLLFDEDGKTYYFSLGDIMTNTSVDASLFVNVDNLLGVNTTSAITEKVINNFKNIIYPIDVSLDYNYTEISDIFINSCLKLPRDYYYITSTNRIKIKDFSDLINTENWEKLFIEITGTKNTNYEQ